MITAYLDKRLKGTPDKVLTAGLVVMAIILVVTAFAAPTWLKLGVFVWTIAP